MKVTLLEICTQGCLSPSWVRGLPCPCRTVSTNQPRPSSPGRHCLKGFTWNSHAASTRAAGQAGWEALGTLCTVARRWGEGCWHDLPGKAFTAANGESQSVRSNLKAATSSLESHSKAHPEQAVPGQFPLLCMTSQHNSAGP